MRFLTSRIRAHYARLESLQKGSFLWRSWLEVTILAYVVANLVQVVSPAGPREDIQGWSAFRLFAIVVLIGPMVETLVFQYLPLEISGAFRCRRWVRMVISIIPFAAMHQSSGMPTIVAAGVVGGFYFAFAYERWRQESLVVGIMVTFLLHSSFNLVGVLSILCFPQ